MRTDRFFTPVETGLISFEVIISSHVFSKLQTIADNLDCEFIPGTTVNGWV